MEILTKMIFIALKNKIKMHHDSHSYHNMKYEYKKYSKKKAIFYIIMNAILVTMQVAIIIILRNFMKSKKT